MKIRQQTTLLATTTNQSAATRYLPSSNGRDGRQLRKLTLQGVTSGGVTTTVEATLDDPAGSPTWIDITKLGLAGDNTNNANYVDVSFMLHFANIRVRAWRVKYVCSDGTNSVAYNAIEESEATTVI